MIDAKAFLSATVRRRLARQSRPATPKKSTDYIPIGPDDAWVISRFTSGRRGEGRGWVGMTDQCGFADALFKAYIMNLWVLFSQHYPDCLCDCLNPIRDPAR